MKVVKIDAEYYVKIDFINMLKRLIKEVENSTFIELTAEYESNFGGKFIAKIENVELEDLRKKP